MEHLDSFILDLALIMTAAGLVSLIAKKLRQPVVLGYIIAGFLISPNFTLLPTVVKVEDINTWAELGIIFLMFALGLEFSFTKIASVGKSAIMTAFTVMASMVAIGYVTGSLLGWEKTDSIFLGCMISMSSTMIILKSYDELKLKKKPFAQVVLGALVIEDIGGIFMMIILSTIAAGKGSGGGIQIAATLGIMLVYLVMWFALGTYLIPTFLKKTEKLMNNETLLIISIAICFIMVAVAFYIGFSTALGAFMAGSIIAGTSLGEKVDHIITPIKDLFGAVFFISVGMLIQPPLLIEHIGPILIITVVTVIGQMIFSTFGMLLGGNRLKTAVQGGFSMVQIGEFSFIVANLGTSLGVTSDFLYPIVVCVSVITSFTTPIFMKNSERAYIIIEKVLPKKFKNFIHRYAESNIDSGKSESMWNQYLKSYTIRTTICCAGMLCTYFAGIRLLPDILSGFSDTASDAICLALMMASYVSLIAIISPQKNMLFSKLWLSSRKNRLPLAALNTIRMVIGVAFIFTSIEHFFRIPQAVSVLIGIVVVAVIARSNYMSSAAINMELRFISNFSDKTLAVHKEKRKLDHDHKWLVDNIYICKIRLTGELKSQTLQQVIGTSMVHVLVIKIIRDGRHINIPNNHTKLMKGDILHVMGTKNGISALRYVIRETVEIEETESEIITVAEYRRRQEADRIKPENRLIMVPLPVNRDSDFSRKSIRNSGIRHNYHGFVIGIERGNLPIVNPNIDLLLEPGDIIWLAGGQQMAVSLLSEGLLDEEKLLQKFKEFKDGKH